VKAAMAPNMSRKLRRQTEETQQIRTTLFLLKSETPGVIFDAKHPQIYPSGDSLDRKTIS
jgi:hypothetical protein